MNWVLMTVLASLSQTLRSFFQKNIIQEAGELASAYSRFLFALPFVLLLALLFLEKNDDVIINSINLKTLLLVSSASICQILFSILLIKLFVMRSFAIGIAFSKTEVIQTTILEIIILSFILTSHILIALILGFIGMLFLSKNSTVYKVGDSSDFFNQIILGASCGVFLGLSSVLFKISLDSVHTTLIIKKVIFLSLLALSFQTVVFGSYIIYVEGKSAILKLFSIWNRGLIVGFFGCAATFFGFLHFL